MRQFSILFLFLLAISSGKAQTDSVEVVDAFKKLAEISFDRSDTLIIEGQEDPRFYQRAAPLILYVGLDSARSWKSAANYKNPEDQDIVDRFCLYINEFLDKDNFKIEDYFMEPEEIFTWHVIEVQINPQSENSVWFAFLKIDGVFVLGSFDDP